MIKPKQLLLDDIALYLDDQKSINEFSKEEQDFLISKEWDLEKDEYVLSRTMHITEPVKLNGNGSTIKCDGIKEGFVIASSDVKMSGFNLVDFPVAVLIDAEGKTIENITVEKVVVKNLIEIGFAATNSLSNGHLRHVVIKNCDVYCANTEWLDVEEELSQQIPFICTLALHRDLSTTLIENCSIEDIWFDGNYSHNGIREPFNFFGCGLLDDGMNDYWNGREIKYRNLFLDGLHFVRNKVDIAWDAAFNFIGTSFDAENIHSKNIEIAENDAGTGIAGIYLFVSEPFYGENSNMTMKHVVIRDNNLHKSVDDVGEPERMVYMGACRLDYYEPTYARNNLLEDIQIYGNTFTGSGPVITGIYSMIDGVSIAENNIVRNVRIHDNTILDAETAFIIDGCQCEGRRHDWNWGSPRHNKKWLDEIENSEVTFEFKNNGVEDVIIENNTVDGYRYKVRATGANVRGHGIVSNNKANKNIRFSNNKFGIGDGHLYVNHVHLEDFCKDGGGNEVDLNIKNI